MPGKTHLFLGCEKWQDTTSLMNPVSHLTDEEIEASEIGALPKTNPLKQSGDHKIVLLSALSTTG